MRGSKGNLMNFDSLNKGICAVAPAFATAIVFSFFLNLLLFVGPLYTLQIYGSSLFQVGELARTSPAMR